VARSIWNGAISFAGIDVPVKVHGATDLQGIQFRELHEPDGAEIAHELVDADGRKVDRRQVVKGFEVRSGEYVVLDDDELKAAGAPKRKTVDIEYFVPREQIDPDVYDRPYYLAPRQGGDEAYALLVAALRKTGRVGVGRVVLRSREQLAAVLEADGMLRLHTMRFADELVDAGKLDHPSLPRKPDARLRKMAAQLVDGLSGRFEAGRYRDTYRDRVLDLVKRKAKGEEIDVERARAPEPSDDLAAALEASLKGSKR
jgi:DNA end-binding protein Ku